MARTLLILRSSHDHGGKLSFSTRGCAWL